MNVKRWFIASIIVFIVIFAFEWLFNNVCLKGEYEATASLWRPMNEMMKNMWMYIIAQIIWALLFCYIYTKGYEGKGSKAGEGLRYGFWLGLFVTIPMSVGMYFSMPIPKSLALSWFVMGMFEFLLCGVIVGLIYKKPEQPAA